MILEHLWRWRVALMTVGVGALAAVLRFVGLGFPQALVFDEVYYARGAFSLLELGYEGEWTGENQDFAQGDLTGLTDEGDYVVHPMVGKLLIGVGIQIFGPTPFGWRFMGALLGVGLCILVALIARHLLRSTLWGAVAGVLIAIDGQAIVLSRSALLDGYLAFFVIAAFGLLLADRARTRPRLLAAADAARDRAGIATGAPLPGMGPATGVRWWRLAAIVTFGLAVSVKWSGLWFAAAFLVLSVVWDMADRRAAGVERWLAGAFVRAIPAFVATVVLIPATYLASWLPWFRSEDAWGRSWAAEHPGEGITWLPEGLRSLVHYHVQMYDFHRGLDSEHNYMATPWLWPLQQRPTAFYFEDVPEAACGAERCVSAIVALGNPVIWWAGALALLWALWRVARHRDMLAATLAVGYLAAWVPWLPYSHRTVFTFYTVVMAPFVVLLVTWLLRRIAQPERDGGAWSRSGTITAVVYLALALIVAGFFAPLWMGTPIPFEYWHLHMWMPSWV